MPKIFKIQIVLGNEAMSTSKDIADALRKIAKFVEVNPLIGTIHDTNGNTVGVYKTEDGV